MHEIGGVQRLACAASLIGVAVLAVALPASAAANTITVTSTADSGAGTLRAAVAAAGSGDTIVLPAGTITLTSGGLALGPNALTIAGQGARSSVIDGNHAN